MNPITTGLGVVAALALAIVGILWWQLGAAQEKLGALQQANQQLTTALKEKQDALDSRARTDSEIRRLPPADVINRLQ